MTTWAIKIVFQSSKPRLWLVLNQHFKLFWTVVGRLIIFMLMLCPDIGFGAQDKIGPWEKIFEKDGIVTYARTNPHVVLKQCKTVGLIKAPVAELENMMRDWGIYRKTLYMAKETKPASFPGCQATPDAFCAYMIQGFPWPVSNRDVYGRLNFYLDTRTHAVLVKVQSTPTNMPIKPGVVRMPFAEMVWILNPVDATHTMVTYQFMIDPGGDIKALPAPVITYVMKYFGTNTVQNFRNLAKEGPYKNAKGIITQAEIPDDLIHYFE